MRGRIIFIALQKLSEASLEVGELIFVIATSPYGTSSAGFEYNLRRRQNARAVSRLRKEERKKYYNLIFRLRRDGLIREKKVFGKHLVAISEKGKRKLKAITPAFADRLPPPAYLKRPGEATIIISFDVPEKYRRKRDWLRQALRRLGFSKLHQSVWGGKQKIPKDFLRDLRTLDLLHCVEIFSVTGKGTLRHVL